MKRLIFLLSVLASYSIWALHPKLDNTIRLVENCLSKHEVLLCDSTIDDQLKSVHMDARGEFVFFLKEQLEKNENKKVISNLYLKLKNMVPYYEELDGKSNWSTKDLKMLLGDVSLRYVKIAPIDTEILKSLYKTQTVQNGRYSLLVEVYEKAKNVTTDEEIDALVAFGEFAKDYSHRMGDENYLYQAVDELIKLATTNTVKTVKISLNEY